MSCRQIMTLLSFSQFIVNLEQSGTRDSGRMVYNSYIFINSNLLPYKNFKQNRKISNIAHTLLLWAKVLFLTKNIDLLRKKYWH